MKCINCSKEFEAKRKSAKFCSPACRIALHRECNDKPVSVTNVTVKDSVTPKDSWLCSEKDCKLHSAPGHGGLCIYHWRIKEGMPHITKDQYALLNQ